MVTDSYASVGILDNTRQTSTFGGADRAAGVLRPAINESMLNTPEPRVAIYKKTKQYNAASSPPFWMGSAPFG